MADNRADMKEAVHLDQAAREAAEEFAVSKGGDDLDPPVPGRKGRLFAACACILGAVLRAGWVASGGREGLTAAPPAQRSE